MYLAEGNAERWKYTHTLRNHTQVFFVGLDDLLSCTEREKNYRTHLSAVSLSPRCQFDGEQKGERKGACIDGLRSRRVKKVFHSSGGISCMPQLFVHLWYKYRPMPRDSRSTHNPSHSGTQTLHAGCYLTRVVRPCQEAAAGQTSPEAKHDGV